MLLFGLAVAIILVIYTRKTEIVTHDPSEGLPGSGGIKNALSAMRDMARQMEEQARAQQSGATIDAHDESGEADVDDESGPLLEEIRDLAQRGQLLDAIKLYRYRFQVDLKSAKEAVEKLAAGG